MFLECREITLDVPNAPIDAHLLLHTLLESQAENLRVRAETPCVGLGTGEFRAVDARLLTGAYADRLSTKYIAD